ncbi:hypothetical protein ACIBEA_43515 [Streptomyces sp. NPDC051555]|uniref:hypothetical protein n=1 Tax=Streptomyces sp. NPDC051555 TaxID=3365657 RepID=UPI00378BE6A5
MREVLMPAPTVTYPPFPGRILFGPGCTNTWVLLVRLRLIVLGYSDETAPRHLERDRGLLRSQLWDDRLREEYTRFQLDLGLRGEHAHGYPTPATWPMLWAPPQ